MLDRLLGDRSPLPFSLVLSLRSQLLRQSISTVLTVFALAMSVALASSVELATRSVSQALNQTADALIGAAEYEVSAGGSGVPEHLIEALRGLPGVASAAPVIQHTFRVDGGERLGEAVRVVAIDLLYENEPRGYQVSQDGFVVRDPLRLVASPNTIVVSADLARRMELREGDVLPLRGASGRVDTVVRGTLEGELSGAFGGQVAVMDVFGLQEVLGRDRRVDRIDLAFSRDADPVAVRGAVERLIGETATVRRSVLRAVYADSILGTLNTTVWLSTVIGILLALFLTYAVTSLTVDRRIEELALLRAAGMQGRTVTRLIVTDVVLIAVVGTVLGLAVAVVIADPLVAVFARASAYLRQLAIPPVVMQPSTLWAGIGVGLPVALLASIEPALRAGKRSPIDVLRGQRQPPSAAGVSGLWLGLAALAGAVGVGVSLFPLGLPHTLRLVVAIVLGVYAASYGVTQLLLLAHRPLQMVLGRAIPRVGYLSGSYLLERPTETGATLAVWSSVTGGLLAILTMVNSLIVTIDDQWVGMNGPDAVMVFAQDPLDSRERDPLLHETIEAIRATPGVDGVAEYYDVETLVRGEEVVVGSFAIDELLRHSDGVRTLSDDPEASVAALRRGELLMSQAFARHFGVEVGDFVTLTTDDGNHAFRIGGWGRGYAGETGVLNLDVATFREWFRPVGAEQVAIWTEGDRKTVLERLGRESDQALFFRHGEAFRRHTAIVVGRFRDLLLVPASLIGCLGMIALVNLLFGNVVGRGRDLSIIRFSGGTAANLMAMVLANGLVVGLLGTVFGVALGVVWSQVAGDTLAQALGYDVVHHVDWAAASRIALAALGVALASSLAPAVVGRTRPARGVGVLD